jgi:hypothetical protein
MRKNKIVKVIKRYDGGGLSFSKGSRVAQEPTTPLPPPSMSVRRSRVAQEPTTPTLLQPPSMSVRRSRVAPSPLPSQNPILEQRRESLPKSLQFLSRHFQISFEEHKQSNDLFYRRPSSIRLQLPSLKIQISRLKKIIRRGNPYLYDDKAFVINFMDTFLLRNFNSVYNKCRGIIYDLKNIFKAFRELDSEYETLEINYINDVADDTSNYNSFFLHYEDKTTDEIYSFDKEGIEKLFMVLFEILKQNKDLLKEYTVENTILLALLYVTYLVLKDVKK